ncbi:MAG: septum formation protein Maf [SAR202 cluster bacterium]|nr:septum formation protein Maf [SAR202 cluster bacterium]
MNGNLELSDLERHPVASPPREQRLLELALTGLGRLGEALAESGGKPVFVFGGIPGERVVAEVLRERRDYIAARVTRVLDPSPDRVAAPCTYFGECTGCQWQHIRYERQLEMKRAIVVDALERIGGLRDIDVPPTLPSPEQFGYRNHARFTVWRGERGARLGYVHRETHRHVDIDRCLLMAPWLAEAMAALQGHVGETTQLSLRLGVNTGEWLLQPRFEREGFPLESGQKAYHERMHGHLFQISSPSFFQVNTHQAERMATLVRDALGLTGEEAVVDAYAGVGTFAVLMADRARRVIAIEESASALVDARVNVAGLPNVELRQGRTEAVLLELAANGPVDAVVLDPPRDGCMPGTLDALVQAPPARIAYISCDPETLARDLAVLTAGPFRVASVQPVDMFPQTHHVESVTVLRLDTERKRRLDARQRLVLASGSPRRRAILAHLGLDFAVAPSNIPEETGGTTPPAMLAERLALAKAHATAATQPSGTVIGADTVVDLDGVPLGKPADAEEARAMLRALRGREHRVITGVALVDAATGDAVAGHRASRVAMRDYADDEIEAYVATGDALDKAGGYAVQSTMLHPARDVHGCYLNVVGFPVCVFLKLAGRFGLRLRVDAKQPWPELDRCPECAKRARGGDR